MNYEKYESPFCTRYASDKMQYIFSAENKFRTFRRLWIALARAEKALGIDISDEQIEEMEKYADDINFEVAEKREKEVRHDVMAHIYAYGTQATSAKPIIHLGATSCYVGDNTDIIVMKQGLLLIREKIAAVLKILSDFAIKFKSLPCLAYTHLQPAQPTTVGKRAALWINELLLDLDEVDFRIKSLKLLGQKGTTGTQASFVELFGEDSDEKTAKLENMIAKELGFDEVVPVSGQTYSRKVDAFVCSTLAGIAESAMKFANDLRILANFKEMEEPFEKNQIGSSAMPYKRNPMRSERICALARYVMTNSLSPAFTAGTQWFERTLDDSANKRIAVAEAFLGVDAILNLYINVTDGLVVYPKIIERRLFAELPFMATENIMMAAVKKGGDRQDLHEKIRIYSIEAAKKIKEEGGENDLLQRIAADKDFGLEFDEISALLSPQKFVGRAEKQTEDFIKNTVIPRLSQFELKELEIELKV